MYAHRFDTLPPRQVAASAGVVYSVDSTDAKGEDMNPVAKRIALAALT
ncbi:hypothetical protein [Streptomyces sp. 3214.6]|nr:hypothetical protein [Streptomyces sp. 3214.6]SHH90559.1 hypothetical protein SAMN05444521_2517 [Streptomyces sp. 3214.6]